MSRMPDMPELSMEWDGRAQFAKVTLDGHDLHGDPKEVQNLFHALAKLRNRAANAEAKLDYVIKGLFDLLEWL